jgi:transcriptional regulator with PAS, ATPase and Fis domain
VEGVFLNSDRKPKSGHGLNQTTIGLKELVDAFSEPSIIIGEDYRILAANRHYLDAYGDTRPDVVGMKCHELSHHSPIPCGQNGDSCPLVEAKTGNHHARAIHIHNSQTGRVFANVEVFPLLQKEGYSPIFLERIQTSPVGHLNPTMDGLVGESPVFSRMLTEIHKVAPQTSTVLILGETGTGKELVSQAIHKLSPRSLKPFVAIDCSGLPDNLIESELFGHEKGAFTGAHSKKLGLVESANGGVLFLDEIGELPLQLQAKLLRLLETGLYRRVGGIEPLRANIRLISATHRDLPTMVSAGTFRQDLYYRLNIFPIHLPPLRERPEDIPLLVKSILGRLSSLPITVTTDAMELLLSYSYPGNIRELKNILERAWILSDGKEIAPDHLPALTEKDNPYHETFAAKILPLHVVEAHYVDWALKRGGDNLPRLAESLGISLRTLYRKIRLIKKTDQ